MVEQITKNNLFFRQLLFLGILILIAVAILSNLSFFIGSFLGSITLYIVFRATLFKLTDKYHWKPWFAALLLAAIAALVLCGLLFGVFQLIAVEVAKADTSAIVQKFNGLLVDINAMLPFKIVPADLLHESSSVLTKAATAIIDNTYSFAINVLMMIVILYFMLSNGHKLETKVARYNPLKGESRRMVNKEITGIIYSNAIGIPLVMLAQGIVAALIYWLFGMHNIVFWAFITALCGLIPMVGSVIVSLPLGIAMMADGFILKGILLILCGLLVIANVDNLLRVFLNKKFSNTHPLIVIFGVILGIPIFGFWGIIFGPLLISIFLLLVRIYYMEFRLMSPSDAKKEKAEMEAESNDTTPLSQKHR